MAVYRIHITDPVPEACRGAVLSIGNFDGVHQGHRALFTQLLNLGQELEAPTAAVTFEPHPLQLLAPERFEPILTTLPDRCELIQAAGVNHVIVLHTETALLELTASDFFRRIIRDGLRARGLVEGPNFGFGRGRGGNVETLTRFCRESGLRCEIVQPLLLDGVMVSSSRVRHALQTGDVATAGEWLGRPYRIEGVVGTGQRRGNTLGFPTANLVRVPTLIPQDGVYAVGCRVAHSPPAPLPQGERGESWAGAANIGPNPTFGETERKVEVHLIGFQGDLYGQTLAVNFHARLRDTRRFGSVDELLAQLRLDVDQAARVVRKE